MSNHFSAAMLKFPGDDPRLDLTDLFLFASPENAGKTVLILDVNPFMANQGSIPTAASSQIRRNYRSLAFSKIDVGNGWESAMNRASRRRRFFAPARGTTMWFVLKATESSSRSTAIVSSIASSRTFSNRESLPFKWMASTSRRKSASRTCGSRN